MSADSESPVLAVEDLAFSYGQLQVLFGVSLELRDGEALALLGTNGAGKSTLLRAISGLERPSAGQVSYLGEDITRVGPEVLPRMGLMLIVGGRAVFSDMTVLENLQVAGLTAKVSQAEMKSRFEDVFATFPSLWDRRHEKAGNLSGGEQQQVALSKAILLRPKVLCIDELSLGLAPIVVAQLIDTVRSLHENGVSLIIVEQSLNIAAELCERAVFLEKGEICFEGSTQELLERDDIARAVFLGGTKSKIAKAT